MLGVGCVRVQVRVRERLFGPEARKLGSVWWTQTVAAARSLA
jgi:hypothetical protein